MDNPIVVVGIDGPAETVAAAVQLGTWEAIRRHTGLRLIAAYEPAGPGHPDAEAAEHTTAFVDALAACVHGMHPDLPVDSAAYGGSPAHALLSASGDAVLLVVAGDARLYFGPLPRGPVAAPVVAHASVPVVVVPARSDPRGADRRVVVGVDPATGAADAVGFAFEEAAARGASLHAMSVYDGPGAAVVAALGAALAPWTEKFPDVPVIRDAIRHPSPLEALCRAAADADLLVVGSGGHGLAAELLRYCPTRFAVVPPPGGIE